MAVVVGRTTAGTAADNLVAGRTAAYKVTASASGSVAVLWAQLKVANPLLSSAQLGIYADDGGVGTASRPSTLLGTANADVLADARGTGAWSATLGTPVSVVSGTIYWLAWRFVGEVPDYQGSATGNPYVESTGNMPAPWTTTAGPFTFEAILWGESAGTTQVSSTRRVNYAVQAQVAATRRLVYAVTAAVIATRRVTYSVQANVTGTRRVVYDVTASTTQVSATRGIVYSVIAQVAATRRIAYTVTAQVSATRKIRYDVQSAVLAQRRVVYNVAKSVAATRRVTYSVQAPIIAPRTIRYVVGDFVAPTAIAQSIGLRYGVIAPDVPTITRR